MKGYSHSYRFDTDTEKLDVGNGMCPSLHLSRAGAASASPAVVEVDDCCFLFDGGGGSIPEDG